MNESTASTQRRAWLVLLVSFAACCVLTIGLPSSVLYVINSASYAPEMNVRLQAGIVTAFCDGEPESDAKVVSVLGRPVQEGCTIMVGADNESISELFVDFPSDKTPSPATRSLVRVQLYAGTRLRIDQARSPRFQISSASPLLQLAMTQGRVGLQLPAASALQVRIDTPQLHMDIAKPGDYSVLIDGVQSHAMVWTGEAQVTKVDFDKANQTIGANQQLTVDAASEGFTPTLLSKNLVQNSDFSSTLLAPLWQVRTDTSDKSAVGQAIILRQTISPTLDLKRVGENLGWGHTGVIQTLSQGVSGTRDLRVRVAFQILEQQIDVCGGQGSECPLMIDLHYRRRDGSVGQWVQGFYARGLAEGAVLPDYMRSNRQGRHVFKQLRMPQLFVSENLMQLIPQLERIETLEVYAEGHSVHTQVMRIELLSLNY